MTSRLSLRARVILASVAAVAATLALVLALVVSTTAERERQVIDTRLERTLDKLVNAETGGRQQQRTGQPARRQQKQLERGVRRSDQGLIVAAPDGPELGRYGLALDTPAVRGSASDGQPQALSARGEDYRIAARSGTLFGEGGDTHPVRFTVFASTTAGDDRISALRSRVLLVGLGGLLLSVFLAAALSRLALRRLDRLRAQADALSEPGSTLLARGGPREIDQLAGSLNEMLERLAAADAERDAALATSRRFAADAGHELRTPLATMGADLHTLADHGNLDAEGQELVGDLLGQHARLRALLEGLQALARGDAGATIERDEVDLGELIDAAIDAARARHPAVRFAQDEGDTRDLRLRAWPQGLRLAIDNLLENAAQHGAASVHVSALPSPEYIELVVDDDGPGIPADEREQVLERFKRGRSARGAGSGLGLALVRQQAMLQHGEIRVEAAPTGGTRILLRLKRRVP